MDFLFLASIFYVVAILGLCAFAVDEAFTLLRKPKKAKTAAASPSEISAPAMTTIKRLNINGLEVRPLNDQEALLMMQVLLSQLDNDKDWEFNADEGFVTSKDGERIEMPFVYRIIRKRIVGENLKIKITQKAYFILMIITEGNPSKAMFVLHKIGNFFEKEKIKNWLLTAETLTMILFPWGIPTETSFNKWWDGQKIPPDSRKSWFDNMVDIFPDEWRKEPIKK